MPAIVESKDKKEATELTLNVPGYREERDWVALALEMDLRVYGPTFEDALDELTGIVNVQISFAIHKGEPELIWRPAEPIYWRLFDQARRERLQEFILSSTPRNPDYAVGGLPLPPPHVIAGLPEFQRADG